MDDPSLQDKEELLLSCRYGDLDDLKSFIQRFGTDSLAKACDQNGNTVLHMASANGHTGQFLTNTLPPCRTTRDHPSCPARKSVRRPARRPPPRRTILPPIRAEPRGLDSAALGSTQCAAWRCACPCRLPRWPGRRPDRHQERRGTLTPRRGRGGWMGRGCQVDGRGHAFGCSERRRAE
jgi:hypothetical protein